MPPVLVFIVVGALLIYIGYLRLQLYIQEKTLTALQHAAIVVQPERPRGSLRGGLFVFGLFLLAAGAIVMFLK
jgi:hypothetical protein